MTKPITIFRIRNTFYNGPTFEIESLKRAPDGSAHSIIIRTNMSSAAWSVVMAERESARGTVCYLEGLLRAQLDAVK